MMKRFLVAALAATFLALPGAGLAQEKVTVWWNKGFYPAEDTALNAAIQKWEQQSRMKIELSFFSTEDMVAKTLSAVEAGSPPDLAFGWTFDFRASPRWAFDGKLEDLSDLETDAPRDLIRLLVRESGGDRDTIKKAAAAFEKGGADLLVTFSTTVSIAAKEAT